jgi:hypothetical protein
MPNIFIIISNKIACQIVDGNLSSEKHIEYTLYYSKTKFSIPWHSHITDN